MIAAGPTFNPCIAQTQPIRIIRTPRRLVTIRMITSNACMVVSGVIDALLEQVSNGLM
jgi:hypothetical protein